MVEGGWRPSNEPTKWTKVEDLFFFYLMLPFLFENKCSHLLYRFTNHLPKYTQPAILLCLVFEGKQESEYTSIAFEDFQI